MLSVYTWGYFRLAYIRRSNVSVPAGSGRYNSDACRFLNLSTNSIIKVRDTEFLKDKFIKDKGLSLKDVPKNTEKFIAPDKSISLEAEGTDAEEETPEAIEPPSKRSRKQKDLGDDFITYNVEGALTFKEAMQFKDAILWKEAINDEMSSLNQNHTWELVDVPSGVKPISCKWIFKKKLRSDGTIEKYKERLVANGFSQKEGIDFFDMYPPVAELLPSEWWLHGRPSRSLSWWPKGPSL